MRSLLHPVWPSLLVVCLAALLPRGAAAAAADNLKFKPAGTNGFEFDTGVLRGKLRAGGKSKGLSGVVHVPTGAALDRSMGLFSHYRVFSDGKRYGTGAWDWPSEARLQPDGSVAVRWPAAPDRPFELRATYQWAAPAALDLETVVVAQTNLTRFESFLASYFTPDFTNSLAWVRELPDQPGRAGFMAADVKNGVWQAFPREPAVAAIINDGRWTVPPSPVDWVLMPVLDKTLGQRRSPGNGLSALVMAPPRECFALMTPQQTEGHYSIYLSLFGIDLKPGQTARARARLVIGAGLADPAAVEAYADYLKSVEKP